MAGRETVHPSGPVDLGAVVAAFADGIGRRGPLGGPLALSDARTAIEVDGATVHFRSAYGLTSGAATLSQTGGALTVTYTTGLPGWGALLAALLALEAAVWVVWAVQRLPFPGGLGVGLLWVVGGMGAGALLGVRFRMRELLVDAARSAQAAS